MSAGLGGRSLIAARSQQQQLANKQPTAALDDLFPSPTNGRRKLRNIESLAVTIASDGLSTPLSAIPAEHYIKHYPEHADVVKASGKPFVVLGGHRRLEAARVAGLPRVPVNFVHEVKSVRIASLLENLQREPLTPVEEGYEFQAAMEEEELSQRAFAVRLGADKNKRVSQTYISQRVALTKLIPELQDDVDDQATKERDTGLTLKFAAEVLARLSEDDQRAFYRGDLTREKATTMAKGKAAPVIAAQSPADQPTPTPPSSSPTANTPDPVIAPQSPDAAAAPATPPEPTNNPQTAAAAETARQAAIEPPAAMPAPRPPSEQQDSAPTAPPQDSETSGDSSTEPRVLTLEGSPQKVAETVIYALTEEELQTFVDLLMVAKKDA